MARKDSKNVARQEHQRGFSDIIGIVLTATALLLLLAQLSFDRGDVSANKFPPNQTTHNWIGSAGAHFANFLFQCFGGGAFVLPVLLMLFGLGYLFEFLSYLKRRWAWAAVLFVTCLGFFDLYSSQLETLRQNINAPSAGGYLGKFMNDLVFRQIGRIGATIVFCTLYAVSLIFLTNFQLIPWLRSRVAGGVRRDSGEEYSPSPGLSPEENALARRARELEKQARKLQEELDRDKDKPREREKSGLGADGRPVPAPTVRDLSVPSARGGKTAKPRVEEPAIEKNELEGEIISAKEIAAASTADILGKRAGSAKKTDRDEEDSVRAPGEGADKAASSPRPSPPSAGGEGARGAGEEEPEKLEPATAASTPPAENIKVTDNTGATRRPPARKKPIAVASTPLIGNYQLPPMDFLQFPDVAVKPTESKEELMANARLMQQTLAQFDIEVSLGDITKGPTITRYELHPAPGVKLEKIVNLNNNIAAALKAERINILAPVPGKSSVGIEVPNVVKTKVIMRDLLESEEWQKSKARIPLALGKDVYGHPIVADLADMPHLLIAGSTGSGKSVCINAIIASLLYKFPPDQLRFVMIDPKVVELQQYNALPHLVVPVVNDPKKVILALRWVVNEMEKRYQIFARVGVRNIKSFNERPKGRHAAPLPQQELPLVSKKEKVEPGADGFAVEVDEEIVVPRDDDIVIPEKLSYIVVIIDELADLMLVAPADVEMAIARITQMARAAGIHCIVATQRPSVDVITGVIKANIPARIAFQVAARVDSRTILDAMGADKLLGKGDMLYLPPGSAKLIRAQGALITDQEIQHVVDYIAKQGKPSYEVEIHQQLSKPVSSLDNESGCGEDESLIEQCIEVIRSEQKASVSLLQRRLKLGYGRAARIMDELENRGIVGPSKGAEPRDILIDLDGEGADGQGVNTAAQ
jgi:S-DNA-T family DNA segregation ATPase FtsK/SpoIIIE